jgi:hypothetical protein
MDKFDKAVIEAAELRAKQREQAARRAAARGAPEAAALLRNRADLDRKLAEDIRQSAEWRDERRCQTFPL